MSENDVRQPDAPETPVGRQRKIGAPSPVLLAALLSVPVAVLAFGAYLIARDAGGTGEMDPLSRALPAVGVTGAVTSAGAPRGGEPAAAGGEQLAAAGPSAKPAAGADLTVVPPTPWLEVDTSATLTRIGVGSCLSQVHPQPIWAGVMGLDKRPDVFLMIGDNVYGDVKSPDLSELKEAYRSQARHPEFSVVRTAIPFLATWDDHDYGANDAGGGFTYKKEAAELFKAYWQIDTGRPANEGIYYARTFGPEGRRVQMIFLDTRFFRGDLTRKSADFPFWGRYEPSQDTSQSMLGAAQWAWLEEQLRQPAEIRLLVSSVQVLAEGHGFERWGNLPHEFDRLVDTIARTGATGVVMLSGDRHAAALYEKALAGPTDVDGDSGGAMRTIAEMTTSSLNRSYGPSKDGPSDRRVSPMFNQENFGLVDIDWEQRRVIVSIRGMEGQDLASRAYTFEALGMPAAQ